MKTTRAILKLSCECPYCGTPHGLVKLHENGAAVPGEWRIGGGGEGVQEVKEEFGVKPVWEV